MYKCSHLWTFLAFRQKIFFWLAGLCNKRVVAVWIALQIWTSWYLWLLIITRKKTFEIATDWSYIYYLDKSVKGKKHHVDPGNLFKPFPNSQGHIISFLSIIFLIRAKISRTFSYVSVNLSYISSRYLLLRGIWVHDHFILSTLFQSWILKLFTPFLPLPHPYFLFPLTSQALIFQWLQTSSFLIPLSSICSTYLIWNVPQRVPFLDHGHLSSTAFYATILPLHVS